MYCDSLAMILIKCLHVLFCNVEPLLGVVLSPTDFDLRKSQQTCHLKVKGLNVSQQSPTQHSADTAFLSLLVALATVYLLPSPTHDRLMVFHYDYEFGCIPVYLPVVG